MLLKTIPAYQLDWNPITVEAYAEKDKEVIMVFNLDITTADKMRNVAQYVVGRTIWCYKNIPPNTKMKLKFDFRGQSIIISKTTVFKGQILNFLSKVNIDDQVSFEFLI